ncbi:hypothetical protein TeGR_g6888, partial [Tetraparma gracilis]
MSSLLQPPAPTPHAAPAAGRGGGCLSSVDAALLSALLSPSRLPLLRLEKLLVPPILQHKRLLKTSPAAAAQDLPFPSLDLPLPASAYDRLCLYRLAERLSLSQAPPSLPCPDPPPRPGELRLWLTQAALKLPKPMLLDVSPDEAAQELRLRGELEDPLLGSAPGRGGAPVKVLRSSAAAGAAAGRAAAPEAPAAPRLSGEQLQAQYESARARIFDGAAAAAPPPAPVGPAKAAKAPKAQRRNRGDRDFDRASVPLQQHGGGYPPMDGGLYPGGGYAEQRGGHEGYA